MASCLKQFLMTSYFVLILFAAKDASGAQFSLIAHSSLLNGALPLGERRVETSINKFASGIWTMGTAVTNASATMNLWQNIGCAGLLLNLASYTNGQTSSNGQPRRTIALSFDATIESWGNTSKVICFNLQGFSSYAAQSSVSTAINFYNLDTSAWGLFWRLKERIAYQRAYEELMAQKASQEYDVSNQIAGELRQKVDSSTSEQLSLLNERYYQEIYWPYISNTSMARTLQFATTEDSFIASDDLTESFREAGVNSAHPIRVTLGDGLASELLGNRVAGLQVNGEQLLQKIVPADRFEDLGQLVDMEAVRKIEIALSTQSPLSFEFRDNELILNLRTERLREGSKEYRNIEVSIGVGLSRERDVYTLDFDQTFSAKGWDQAQLSQAEVRAIEKIVRKVIPPVSFEIPSPRFSLAGLPLKVSDLKMTNGRLSILTEIPDTLRMGGSNQEHSGDVPSAKQWCEEGGGAWMQEGSCNCGSMWYRADSIAFYGRERFMASCRESLRF